MKEFCALCGEPLTEDNRIESVNIHKDCLYIMEQLWDMMARYDMDSVSKNEYINAIFDYCADFVCPHCKDRDIYACSPMDCIPKIADRLKQYRLIKIKDEWQEIERWKHLGLQ